MTAAAVLAVLPYQLRAAELTPFKVGIAAPTVNMLPLWVAQSSGLFRARGLNVEIFDTAGGSRGLAQVGSGKLQAMVVGLSAVLDANGKTGDYRLIASGANTMSFRFFGAKGILGADRLRGRKVGISSFGSESDSAATMALKRLGLTRADVEIVEAGGTTARLDALKSGKLAATALNEPADTEAKTDGLPLLVDLKADLPWIFTAIAVDRNYLADHRQQALAFLRAYIEGIDLALSDPARARKILSDEFREFSPAAVDAAYADFRARVPRDAMPSRSGAELMLRETGNGAKPLTDYIDATLLDDLRRDGFFDELMRRYRVR
ncbi:MAG TPA: ABC transporter substrate-binding protein [Micropepsaceae bacterium]|nr:ABC transporter substrate-binding protein [Micropepsaceae bacterium]